MARKHRGDPEEAFGEILLEVTPVGHVLRVAALDPETLAEATFQAPASADRAALLALARQKLAFVVARTAEETARGRRARPAGEKMWQA